MVGLIKSVKNCPKRKGKIMSANKELGLNGSNALYDKYLRCCDQATAIEKRLSNNRITERKRELLEFHLKDCRKE